MRLEAGPFSTIDWEQVPSTEHPGETGIATWRTVQAGEVRVRKVEYSAGYVADHWCSKGHVILVLEGELVTELKDGRTFTLRKGMTYTVKDGGEAHRSLAKERALLFIVD